MFLSCEIVTSLSHGFQHGLKICAIFCHWIPISPISSSKKQLTQIKRLSHSRLWRWWRSRTWNKPTNRCSKVPHPLRTYVASNSYFLLSRILNTVVKNPTSMQSIWQDIGAQFDFQSTRSRFMDFNNIRLERGERLEDRYQRLVGFIDDNLLPANGRRGYLPPHGRLLEVPDCDWPLTSAFCQMPLAKHSIKFSRKTFPRHSCIYTLPNGECLVQRPLWKNLCAVFMAIVY